MQVILGNTSSDHRKLNKNFNQVLTINAQLKTPENSILNPVSIVTGLNANINYLYIPQFLRYYYVVDILPMEGGRSQITCKVDPLMSHRDSIKNVGALVARSSSGKGSPYLIDDKIKTLNYDSFSVKKFPNSFLEDNWKNVLIVCG